MTAAGLVKRIVALIPPKGVHLTRFHGVFAPTAASYRFALSFDEYTKKDCFFSPLLFSEGAKNIAAVVAHAVPKTADPQPEPARPQGTEGRSTRRRD